MITIDSIKPNVPVTYNKNPGHIPMNGGFLLGDRPDKPLTARPMRLTGNVRNTIIKEIDSDGNTAQHIQAECRGVIGGESGTFWMDIENLGMLS